MTPDAPRLVVGTAGHIDHGKSRLVHALTGVDPDRLPEEKARGMTIDLGFAHTRIDGADLWFVDVPGHERFIRNMVAGATGIDLPLLVVAANDSVMPQTREHAEVLRLLGFERCLVALTKMDLVDEEWADAVEQEATELLGALGIAPARVLRVSAETGRGIAELRAALAACARESRATLDARTWFRLPIDRAFNVPGRGVVVTGTVAHGDVRSDDTLELWPAGRGVRVRDIQTHHEATGHAAGRMRLAVNLAGLALTEVWRGCELATPGYLEPTRLLDVRVDSLRMPGKAIRTNLRLRLHIGTCETTAELRLVERPAAPLVRGAFAQLRTREPIVACWRQPFILRDEGGARTLGGGRVLAPVARAWSVRRRPSLESLETLASGPPNPRVEQVVCGLEWDTVSAERLAARAGLASATEAEKLSRELLAAGRLIMLGGAAGGSRACESLAHRATVDGLSEHLTRRVEAHLREQPRSPGVSRREWPNWMPRACPERRRPLLAEWLMRAGGFALAGEFVVPRGHTPAMSEADAALLESILAEFRAAAFQPPDPERLRCIMPRNAPRVGELIDLAVAREQLVRVAEGIFVHADLWREMIERLARELRARGGLAVSDIRTLLGSSRKYVVPILERLDAAGVTRRVGDQRVAGPKAPAG